MQTRPRALLKGDEPFAGSHPMNFYHAAGAINLGESAHARSSARPDSDSHDTEAFSDAPIDLSLSVLAARSRRYVRLITPRLNYRRKRPLRRSTTTLTKVLEPRASRFMHGITLSSRGILHASQLD